MKAIWIDENQSPDYQRLFRHGIRRLYFTAREGYGHDKTMVDNARAQGFEVGIYRVSSWDLANNPNLTGAEWANLLSKDVSRYVGGDGKGTNVQLAVQMDIEEHNPVWIAQCLLRWRQIRQVRDTSFTFEPFQGGMLVAAIAQIIQSNVRLVPQAYMGPHNGNPDMTPADPFGVVKDLTDYRFPYERIQVFYDAARLYRGWTGYAFTAQRLPA